MATEIRVPPLGESVVEATVGRWLKREGDPVAVGEPVVELETEKVNTEVPADEGGVLVQILRPEGATVRPGEVLGLIAARAEAAAPSPPAEAPAPRAAPERGAPARVRAWPAQHWTRRGPCDTNRRGWSAWGLEVAGRKVFFAGDTGYGPHLAAIGGAWGPVDVALLPIGAYAPREVMAPVHLDPEEAVRAYLDLGGRGALVPIHWGTFRLSDEPLDEPPRRLAAAWQAAGLPPERLWRLRPGEVRRLG